jgi:hypothetical protein
VYPTSRKFGEKWGTPILFFSLSPGLLIPNVGVPQVSPLLRDLGTPGLFRLFSNIYRLRTKLSFNACMAVDKVSRCGSLTRR